MWCDNCLLVLPLRAGAIAWAVAIAIYNLGGGIFLLKYGQYLFFFSPEWQIFGGIGLGVMGIAIITIGGLATRSYVFSRAAQFIWPFVIIACAVRAIIMIVELNRGKEKIQWECDNGGQLYWESVAANISTSPAFPTEFCLAGFPAINTAFIVSLLVDLVFQIYMFFPSVALLCETGALFRNERTIRKRIL